MTDSVITHEDALLAAGVPEAKAAADAAHYQYSTLRERIVEHVFVGEALRALWRRGVVDAEVLRPEFDAHGYDLVMGRGKVVRHIQFKASTSLRPDRVSVSESLSAKPSGCVIWIRVTDHLDIGPFFWFGGAPGEKLPPICDYQNQKRTTPNMQGAKPPRKNHRNVPGKEFRKLATVDDVLDVLFGLAG